MQGGVPAIRSPNTTGYKPGKHSAYTKAVDKVRLGRALGYGTRHMAKTVAAVAEAATAPQANRTAAAAQTGMKNSSAESSTVPSRTAAVAGQVLPRHTTARNLGSRAQHLKRSVWQPLAVFSGALWLRVTGTFFALIASTMGTAAWRQRPGLHAAAHTLAAHHFWLFTVFTGLFGYFAVSSFIRAHLKERRALTRR